MKTVKLFILAIVSLFLTGCYSSNSNESATIKFADNTNKLDSIRLNDSTEITPYFQELNSHYIDHNGHILNSYRRMLIYKFNYDGHKYIMFSVNKYENGVIHDPDCKCFNKH